MHTAGHVSTNKHTLHPQELHFSANINHDAASDDLSLLLDLLNIGNPIEYCDCEGSPLTHKIVFKCVLQEHFSYELGISYSEESCFIPIGIADFYAQILAL